MAAVKKKRKKPIFVKIVNRGCTVCAEKPLFNGELCEPCDASYEEWLTGNKGSSIAWVSGRLRAILAERIHRAFGNDP